MSSLLPPVSRRAHHLLARQINRLRRGEREFPTYFIVGAKRAGTTSLDEYLIQHPLVLRGLVEKGCRYYDVNYHRGPAWFRTHLPVVADVDRLEARLGARPIVGESSPYYCFHPDAPARIAADVPGARLIMMLRDPVQRAWSHYRYEKARGFEPLGPLEALEAEERRLGGSAETTAEYAHRHFSYLGRSLYGEQVTRLLKHFPREQLLLVNSEDLFAEPAATMQQVFSHVGLPGHAGDGYLPHKALGDAAVPDDFAAFLHNRLTEDLAVLGNLHAVPGSWG